ncbi:MAG: AMP-binding protein [Rhodospirillaceae bacterium]|jgi:fatty-acyl-CoA synthase|nr:AMP-binding protein [Rhodospirillaceae bacterium]MBT4042111.1 AMP-binding protein [Rhodospirillaceae bacterium]MBT4688658.1 AMP-binding protein [Rhodospirillaceae bacterium]MBT5078992.1 AMP-binding protein [Rhodospirillaceae bacterium]MBT5523411.1 AMP-binding protein [Rhodospirillaceae bacterium]
MEWYVKRRIGDLADDAERQFGSREGLVFQDKRYSFAEVAGEVDRAAKGLMAQGIKRGDHVALWLNNCADWIFISFGLAKIGAVQVPINTRFRTADLEYVVRQSDSTVLITHDTSGPIDYLAMVREVVSLPKTASLIEDANFPELRQVIIVDDQEHEGTTSWNKCLNDGVTITDGTLAARAAAVDPDDLFLIMYTSGTTGFPKGAMHSHKLIPNNEARAYRMAYTANDVILNYLPLFHALAYSECALMSFLSGARHIITETFDPHESLDLIAAEGVSIIHGFEAHLKGLTEAQEVKVRDVSSLRTGIFAAGMHSATPVVRRGAKVLAPLINLSGFGMTECWLGVALNSLDDSEELRCESSGYVGLGYEIRVVDPDSGEDRPIGVPGELLVRSVYVMLGYYKKPEETAVAIDQDGWFHTGDTSEWLPGGYLRFLGRYKDMLKVGGENVDPMETEGFLLAHDDIHQIAIVGYPDEKMSEVPVAFVEKAPGSNITADNVIDLCRGKVASFKVPRHVIFVTEFPMTASGKIRKVDLRAEALRLLGD